MRSFLAPAAIAAAFTVSTPISTSAQAIAPALLRSALERVDATERVARMCREVCNQNVCRRRCFERADHNEAYVERRNYRDRYRDEDRWRYRDYERGAGVRFHLGLD